MKKGIGAFIAFAMLGGGIVSQASAQSLTLSFNRTGTDASSVTVLASGIDGITATLNSVSPNLKSSAGAITSAILCPNARASANDSPIITFDLTVSGLPDGYSFTNIGYDIHALNGTNGYQEHNDNQVRQWNVNTKINNQDFHTFSNIDIAAGVNPGGDRHKVWNATVESAVSVSSTMNLTITVTKGTTNGGCFFGLSSITFSDPRGIAMAEFETYTATRAKRLSMLDLWNGAETSATEITIANQSDDWDAELEEKKAQFDAAEDALYAALDNRNFVFRKNSLSANENHVISFISSNSSGLYATHAPDASSIWRAHRTEGRTFKFENEATGRWFGSTASWVQEQQIPTASDESGAAEYSLDYIPAGSQASEAQLKGAVVLVNSIYAAAENNADKHALHHGNSDAGKIVCWFANANTASYRKSSWHASILSDEAARAMAAGYLTGTGYGQYTVISGEPVQLATLSHNNAASEIARFEENTATFSLNTPASGSYVSVNGTKYYYTEDNTLCNYETGRYMAASQDETESENALAFTFGESKIAHYNLTANVGIVMDNVTVGAIDALPVSTSAEFITFIAPVAVSFSETTAEVYVAQITDEALTVSSADAGVVYAAGTGFIIKIDGQTVEFVIADSDADAVSDYAGTFKGTYEAYTFVPADPEKAYYTIMPSAAEAQLYSDTETGNTVSLTLLKEGDSIAPNTAIIELANSATGQYPEQWLLNLNGETSTTGISSVSADVNRTADAIFDLTGRHVLNIRQAGVYITGGKKIYVK